MRAAGDCSDGGVGARFVSFTASLSGIGSCRAPHTGKGGEGTALGETTTPPARLWLAAITATSLRGAALVGTQTSPLSPPIKSMDWPTFRTPPTPHEDIITYYSTEGFSPTWVFLHVEGMKLTAALK
ncbi:hypothetical protein E2C01_066424 [Portunus trituberculatus]|uniref:Uncharacterized protein n=1 Tax=Portunus trituberculatus TaxID=210409 RepID=A0A5B7HI53_PORTR|nr:hypothetical protein [Portunus trituberculatus]